MRKLLKESDIRHMMKLAAIPALSNGFINKLNETSIYDEDLNEQDDDPEGEDPMAGLDMGEPAGEPPGEPAMDEPAMDEPVEGAATVESTLDGLGAFLEGMSDPEIAPQVAGKIQVDKTDEEGPEGEDELGLDEPEGEDVSATDELPGPEAAADDEDLGLGEAQIDLEEEDDVVNEVVRRVAKRLIKSKR